MSMEEEAPMVGGEPDDTPGQLRYSETGVNTPYISVFSAAKKQTDNCS